MGKHSGEGGPHEEAAAQAAYAAPRLPRRRLLVLALLVMATLIAWGVLVYAAIDFGSDARSGESGAWVLLGLATLGAAACLFVTLLLGARMVALVRRPQEPARATGGHRARR